MLVHVDGVGEWRQGTWSLVLLPALALGWLKIVAGMVWGHGGGSAGAGSWHRGWCFWTFPQGRASTGTQLLIGPQLPGSRVGCRCCSQYYLLQGLILPHSALPLPRNAPPPVPLGTCVSCSTCAGTASNLVATISRAEAISH